MLRLTLIRHAKAEPADHGTEDWQRPLEPRGQRDAREMGRRLKERGFKPRKVLSSPAERAWMTAVLLGRELGIAPTSIERDEQLYLASPKQMISVVREQGGSAAHLMVFGHNPGITEFADRLSSERSVDNMPTCAVYTLEFAVRNWSDLVWDSGIDADFDYPKKVG